MLEVLFDALVEGQRQRVLKEARKILPRLTDDDILQPNDFPLLENNPYFRYEEGVLEGMLSARMAYLAWKRDGGA